MIDRSAVEEDMCRRADPEPRFDQTGTVFEEQLVTIPRLEDRRNPWRIDPTHGTGDLPWIEIPRSPSRDEQRILQHVAKDRERGGPAEQ